MARLNKDDILKLARLARLHLDEAEVDGFAKEITAILDYVELLQKVDVEGVLPTYQVTGLKNVTRPDEVKSYGATPKDLMKNAPAVEAGQFKVKRMVG